MFSRNAPICPCLSVLCRMICTDSVIRPAGMYMFWYRPVSVDRVLDRFGQLPE